MGRPTKFTNKVCAKILEGIRGGLTRSAAAGTVGVHPAQIGRWCRTNATFANDCDIAEAEAEARFTAIITNAAQNGDPKMALEWLKRRRRDDWGDNERVTHGGSLEFIATAAASADAKFNTILARSRPADLLDEPDAS